MENLRTSNWKKNIPNALTAFRFVLVPFFVYLLIKPSHEDMLWAAIVFLIASITDWLDGFIARLYEAESILGKLLDPLADKILVMSALVMLCSITQHTGESYVPAWIVVILLGREFLVTGLRSVAAVKGTIVAASRLAKYKTALTMISIVLLLLAPQTFIAINLYKFGIFFLWLATFVSIGSGMQYAVTLRRFLT